MTGGIDSSPIDNSPSQNPGTTFPTMATLESLAAGGLRFTNAYSQPVCSPTRAAIMTGRQAFRTGVGDANHSLLASETTLPEAFTAAGSPYQLAAFGKWHLGGGRTGYSTLGGWPHFVGITGGGVPNQDDGYVNWAKNDNGRNANSTTYTTTDQVTEAKTFIDAQETADQPWFVWMGFNAPHTPFHEPPAELLQGVTGTSDRELYHKALEALDTEIGRLLQSVDLTTTNIILIGDNGTPAQVVQAPFGPTGPGGHSKGDLYEGGIHVPMVFSGPCVGVPAGSTTDKLVHVVDLYSTILEMAGVAVPTTAVDSTSINPILSGSDTADRVMIAERFGEDATPGRSIRLGTYPDYKLIIFGDPLSTQDVPTYEFFNLANDPNEAAPLAISSLTGDALAAYGAMIAKDVELGGGYGEPSFESEDYYDQADFFYAYFSAQGEEDSALAYWFYFRAYGDQAYYSSLGNNPYAQFKFYEGIAYFYYTFYKNSAPNLAAYFLYLNFAYAYLDYYNGTSDPAAANSLYSTYYALALASL